MTTYDGYYKHLNGGIKMETINKRQKLFCPEHGKQKIEAIDIIGNVTEYILACGDIIKK
ncbi:Uncharacterised protein [uncultured archaeon]|nr:Uncharacterised protein [uncultured archaeon]